MGWRLATFLENQWQRFVKMNDKKFCEILRRAILQRTHAETRRGGRPSPHFVLRNRTEHLYYTKRRRSTMKDLSKHMKDWKVWKVYQNVFKLDQDCLNWKFLCKNKTTPFSFSRFFLFVMCLPKNSIPYYTSITPSMLEEFRPVSA